MSVEPVAEDGARGPLDLEAVVAVGRVSTVASILEVCCRVTGMGFAAVARVTETEWTACAVRDEIDFGLEAGGQLEVATTLCHVIRRSHLPIVFDHAAENPDYSDHHTPRLYGLQSYISVPIIRADGSVFGTLCAIDRLPRAVSRPEILAMFELFAQLIASQLENDERLAASQAALMDEQQVSELRDHFIAVLGHDLRNPLASVEAGIALLRKRGLDEASSRIIDQMQASSGRMARLINDVLDFARGRLGGGLPIAVRPAVALKRTIEQVIHELSGAHPDREMGVELALRLPVMCDPDRIAQLLSNLLANAVAHGEGDIRIHASSDAERFVLSVANGGARIPEAGRARLFLPFQRDGSSRGLGLGLYIAAEIAQAHGGRIDVVSDADETRFTFVMPMRR